MITKNSKMRFDWNFRNLAFFDLFSYQSIGLAKHQMLDYTLAYFKRFPLFFFFEPKRLSDFPVIVNENTSSKHF